MQIVNVGRAREQGIGKRYGKNSVIGESAFGDKERKVRSLLRLELMHRADNVACDGAYHYVTAISPEELSASRRRVFGAEARLVVTADFS